MSKPLSFGVEFEFLVALVPSGYVDPDAQDPRPVHYGNSDEYDGYPFLRVPLSDDVVRYGDIYHTARYRLQRSIARALARAGLPALSDEYEDYWNPMNGTFYTDKPSARDPWGLAGLVGLEEPRRWVVSIDGSICSPDKKDRNYEWHKIEVKSPAYYYSQHSLKAVQLALHTLTNNFRCHVNESCGFHVHVGSGADGFRLSTIQNLMGLLWTFDDTVLTIHPWHRRLEYRWCANLRLQSLLGICGPEALRAIDNIAHFREPRCFTTAVEGLLAMNSVDSLAELALLVHRHPKFDRDMRYAAYNLENVFTSRHDLQTYVAARNAAWLRESSFGLSDGISDINMLLYPNKRTIEFRQHEATLDAARVTAWIQTAVGLVHLSRSTPAPTLSAFVQEIGRVSDNRYSQAAEASNASADEAGNQSGSADEKQDARRFGRYLPPLVSMPELLHGVGLHAPARYYTAFLARNRNDADYVVGGLYRPRAWYDAPPREVDPWAREYAAGAYGVGGTRVTLPSEPPSPDVWVGADGGGFRSFDDRDERAELLDRRYDEGEERGRSRYTDDEGDEGEEGSQEYYDVPQSPTSDEEPIRGGTRPAGEATAVSQDDIEALDTSQSYTDTGGNQGDD